MIHKGAFCSPAREGEGAQQGSRFIFGRAGSGVGLTETSDKALLRRALRRDPAGTFYMAADLVSPLFEQCRWFVESEDGRASAVVLAFFGLEVPTILVTGDLGSLRRVLGR
jgi:hypothetical protein